METLLISWVQVEVGVGEGGGINKQMKQTVERIPHPARENVHSRLPMLEPDCNAGRLLKARVICAFWLMQLCLLSSRCFHSPCSLCAELLGLQEAVHLQGLLFRLLDVPGGTWCRLACQQGRSTEGRSLGA